MTLDIDFPASSVDSVRDEVAFKELEELVEINDEMTEDGSKQDCSAEEAEIVEEHIDQAKQVPSAPDIEYTRPQSINEVPVIHSKLLYDKTIYPDLQEVIQSSSTQISENNLSTTVVKPFTPLQIEQLYSNREVQLIEMFESEFVEKELKDNSIQEHPLYALLKKFGKSRAKYLVNLRNVAHLSKTLDENYKKIWRVEKGQFLVTAFVSAGRQ